MDEPDPPRGRWRLVYDGDKGFAYSVQPRRQARRFGWPSPDRAWREFTHWEASRSAAERNSTGRFDYRRLLRNIQATDPDDEMPRGPHTMRVVLADYVESAINPEDEMNQVFRNRIINPKQNELCDAGVLQRAIVNRRDIHGLGDSPRDYLSRLPLEVLDLILIQAIEVHFDLIAFVDPPPPQRLRNWSYTAAERAVLTGIPRSLWPLVSAIPTFRVSRLLREQTASSVRRVLGEASLSTILGFPSKVPGSALVRMDYEDTTLSERETEVLGVGVAVAEGEMLREISPPIAHLVTQMTVEITWDQANQRLLSPVKRLIGMESNFLSLRHILVRCRVINVNIPDTIRDDSSSSQWKDLAASLYGPSGVYAHIAEEVSRALTTALWAALARRTGLWPGYCLRPTCTPHDGNPCRARPPFMAHRVPILDIDLLPDLV